MSMARESAKKGRFWGLHPNVLFLGVVSFLTDVSSEMIFTSLPLFLCNILGVKTSIIGLIEGVSESTGTILRIYSGWLSDKLGKRKFLTVVGYGLSAIAKFFMLLASTWGIVLAVRFGDRVGKGVRSAPRDALIADSTAEGVRGKSFGLHRAMDTAGASLGIFIAAVIIYLSQRNSLELTLPAYRLLVVIGVVPAVLGVLILMLMVKDLRITKRQVAGGTPSIPKEADKTAMAVSEKKGFDPGFKLLLGVLALFTLGNSSDAFLILRAQNVGTSTFHILLMLCLFNLVYSLLSTPAGTLSDKWGRKNIIAAGWIIFALTRFGFGMASSPMHILLLFAFYGLYYAFTEGVAKALIADMVPVEKRGTAYGLYYGVVGATALPASVLAGWLWQAINPAAPFFLGAGLSVVAVVALLMVVKQ